MGEWSYPLLSDQDAEYVDVKLDEMLDAAPEVYRAAEAEQERLRESVRRLRSS